MPTIDSVPKDGWRDKNFLNMVAYLRASADMLVGFELINVGQRNTVMAKIDRRIAAIEKRRSTETD